MLYNKCAQFKVDPNEPIGSTVVDTNREWLSSYIKGSVQCKEYFVLPDHYQIPAFDYFQKKMQLDCSEEQLKKRISECTLQNDLPPILTVNNPDIGQMVQVDEYCYLLSQNGKHTQINEFEGRNSVAADVYIEENPAKIFYLPLSKRFVTFVDVSKTAKKPTNNPPKAMLTHGDTAISFYEKDIQVKFPVKNGAERTIVVPYKKSERKKLTPEWIKDIPESIPTDYDVRDLATDLGELRNQDHTAFKKTSDEKEKKDIVKGAKQKEGLPSVLDKLNTVIQQNKKDPPLRFQDLVSVKNGRSGGR